MSEKPTYAELAGRIRHLEGRITRLRQESRALEIRLREAGRLETIGRLTGGIAHDFNNILSAIIGYGELTEMFELPGDSEAAACLKEMLDSAYRGQDLIQQLLNLSRQTEGEKIPFSLGPVVRAALKLVRSSLPASVEIRQEIGEINGVVVADPVRIHQLLIRLCTDLSAHIPQAGGGLLKVTLGKYIPGADVVRQVPDLGPGAYARLCLKDVADGEAEVGAPGLGSVSDIVRDHGGAITIEGRSGRGPVVQIFFPLRAPDPVGHGIGAAVLPTGEKCRILFADDEPYMTDFAGKMLARLGYEVVACAHGLEALAQFRDNPDRFDLVITDQSMPHMTGLELARELARIRSDVPIVLCTGLSEAISPESAKAAGVWDLAHKPVGAQQLADIVLSALAEKIRGKPGE